MIESQIHNLNKQLKQQQLSFEKEKAIYEQKISQQQEKIKSMHIRCETYKKSHTMLVSTIDDIYTNKFSKFYGKFNTEIEEIQSLNEQNTKKLLDSLNHVFLYVQVN